jgi:hypothetical protein
LQLGLKVPVYVYDATLRVVINEPFDSLLNAAKYFDIEYRAIARHLDTKKAVKRKGRLVYLFKKKLDAHLSKELLTTNPTIADSRNARTKLPPKVEGTRRVRLSL